MIVKLRVDPDPPNTMLLLGTREVFDEVPDTIKSPASVSVSSTVNGIAPVAISSLVLLLVIFEIEGKSFTDITVRTNVSLAELLSPSVTVTVMVVEPIWFEAGVIVTVREEPEPPKEIFPFGTRVVFDEEPEIDKLALESSTSLTVKGISGVEVSSLVLLSVIFEMVGGSLTAMTLRTNVSFTVPPSPSVTVIVMIVDPY